MKHSLISKCLLAATLLSCATATMAQMTVHDDDDKYATELIKAGETAPELKMKTLEGKQFKLSSLRGSYVVLDFWASWCPDCRKDAPNVVRMYRQFAPQGVKFVGVSMDTDKEKWAAAVQKYGMDYTHVSELVKFKETQVAADYHVSWIPTMYLIDPEGRVVLSTVVSDKIDRKLSELTAQHLPIAGSSQDITPDGAKGKLAGILQLPDIATDGTQKVPLVLLLHGFGGKKEGELFELIADSLQAHGIASLRFDFNGHGQSEGEFKDMTVPNEIDDVLRVYDYVTQLPWVSSVSLVGHSQGGVVASMVAGTLGTDKISSVVLMAPAAVLRDDAIRGNTMGAMYDPLDPPETVELWGGRLLGYDYIKTAFTLPIYETAAKYTGPALIVHGTGDRVVPYTYGLRYHQQWQGSEYLQLEGFDHGFTQNIYRATKAVSDFLLRQHGL